MKKLVKVEEVEGEGLVGLLGEVVFIMCMNYFYTGKLIGVNDTFVLLENCKIVYETGSFNEPNWKDAQKISDAHYVRTNMIESYCKATKS